MVRRVNWHDACDRLRAIRTSVFVQEQHVPEELEWDGLDEHCLHVLAEAAGGDAIGTGRLLPDGHIGRMAVVKEARRRGVGAAILKTLLEEAGKRGHAEVVLSAQLRALEFYREHGFVAEGKVFEEAGILHQTMRKRL